MTKPGPVPKPTALEIAQGRPGKRPINKQEAKPSAQKPRAPSYLCHAGKLAWKRLATPLHEAGLLTYIDGHALAMLCQTFGRWVEAETMIDHAGGPVQKTPNGFQQKNPWVNIAKELRKDWLVMAREFGLTPSARTRIKIDLAEEGVDELDQMLALIMGANQDQK